MSDLNRLVEEFAADYEAGRDADVGKLLDDVPPDQRQELASLLDSYLMQAPPRPWDPVAYESSLAKVAVDRVYESIEGVSGTWPELLPHLRNAARIKRRELVERLAGALGFDAEPEIEKVGVYYNRMEHGTLPADGVSGKVIEALAGIVDSTVEALRAAGARSDEAAGGLRTTFARTAFLDASYGAESLHELSEPDASEAPGSEPRRDEIDSLFLDG